MILVFIFLRVFIFVSKMASVVLEPRDAFRKILTTGFIVGDSSNKLGKLSAVSGVEVMTSHSGGLRGRLCESTSCSEKQR